MIKTNDSAEHVTCTTCKNNVPVSRAQGDDGPDSVGAAFYVPFHHCGEEHRPESKKALWLGRGSHGWGPITTENFNPQGMGGGDLATCLREAGFDADALAGSETPAS